MKDKFLYQPVKPFFVNQYFGNSEACIEDDNRPIAKRKVVGKVNGTCPTGFVELYPLLGMKGHTGLDLQAKKWQPVYASQNGWVHELQTEPERGLGIGIITNDKYFCQETKQDQFYKYRNWHLAALNVQLGDKVRTGQLIGWADSTGLSSGDHDHFETKPVDKNSSNEWYNVLQENGYFGAVDPMVILYDKFALEVSLINQILEAASRVLDLISRTLRKLPTKKDSSL